MTWPHPKGWGFSIASPTAAAAVLVAFWPTLRSKLLSGQATALQLARYGRQASKGPGIGAYFDPDEVDKLCRAAGRPRNLTGQSVVMIQGVMGAVTAVLVTLTFNLFAGIVAGVAGWAFLRLWLIAEAQDRQKRIELELPVCLDVWGLLLMGGDSLESGLVEIVRQHSDWLISTELRLALDRAVNSEMFSTALIGVARETGAKEFILAAEQIRQLIDSGVGATDELRRIAKRLREDRSAALTKGAQTSAIFGLLPKMGVMFLAMAPLVVLMALPALQHL